MTIESEQIKKAKKMFFVSPERNKIFTDLDLVLSTLEPPFQALGFSFKRNLLGAIDVAALPFLVASNAVRLSLAYSDGATKPSVAWRIYQQLSSCLEHEQIIIGLQENLNQALLNLWSCFEVFTRDFLTTLLNHNPEYLNRLANAGKEYFDKQIPIQILKHYGFNVSDNLGDIFIQHHDIHAMPYLKSVFKILFPENHELHEAFSDKVLWQLHDRRNLIVHHLGIAAKRYFERSVENLPPGEQVKVTSDDIYSYLDAVTNTVARMLSSL